MTTDTGLAKKMEALADRLGLPHDHELRVRAQDFEMAAERWAIGRCSIKRFMGIWARARRCYIAHSGKTSILED